MSTILIADDDVNFFNSISIILINAGFNVIHAKNTQELLQKADAKHSDLILLDISLEKIEDGLLAGKELFQKGIKTPIIILENVVKMTTLSIDTSEIAVEAYAEKPVDTDKLISKINTILSRSI